MNRDEYKNVIDQIEPDAGLQNRLAQGLYRQKPSRIRRRSVVYIMAGLFTVLIVGIAMKELWGNTNQTLELITKPIEQTDPYAVTIPKIELTNNSNAEADMIGLVVYKGNIYTQMGTSITPEIAESLLGDKLGRTKGNIDEWSTQTDYTELASSIGVTDIYLVKGYDSDFRIMS